MMYVKMVRTMSLSWLPTIGSSAMVRN